MSVTITPVLEQECYEVNDKEVYKDSNDNWICRDELTPQEAEAFRNYKKAVIENKEVKSKVKATYKY